MSLCGCMLTLVQDLLPGQWVLPTIQVGLCKIIFYGHSQRPIAQVVLDPAKLTININQHNYQIFFLLPEASITYIKIKIYVNFFVIFTLELLTHFFQLLLLTDQNENRYFILYQNKESSLYDSAHIFFNVSLHLIFTYIQGLMLWN